MGRSMVIQIKKGADGPPALTCVRADGSRTWGKIHRFLPEHDLTHGAVESVLELEDAFFGLVASGWNLDDFTTREAAARLPVEAHWAESVVGLLDLERGTGREWNAEEFNGALEASLRDQKVPAFRTIGEDELARTRAVRNELIRRWKELAPGGTLEIPFPVDAPEGEGR
jgi:hypothetical protein